MMNSFCTFLRPRDKRFLCPIQKEHLSNIAGCRTIDFSVHKKINFAIKVEIARCNTRYLKLVSCYGHGLFKIELRLIYE